jgi:hypothetical protein
MKTYLFIALIGFLLISCKQQSHDYKKVFSDPVLYSKTVKRLNDVVLENNFPPMIASRNYAYANIAAYECVAAGDNNYISMGGQLKDLPATPKPDTSNGKEIDFHLAALLAFTKIGNAVTFPEGSMMGYYDELKKMADSTGMPSSTLKNSIAFSDSIAAVVMRWSKKDNYAETRSAEKYTVTNDEGRWIPTPPMYGQAIEPHWREIRCMVMDSCSQFMPPRPPKFDIKDKNGTYFKALMEIKSMGDSLTDEQKNIADFWDDNPFKLNVSGHVMFGTKKFSPGGHWMNIVGIAAQKANADFATTVAASTETSIALFDAFISCWDEKYRSNYVRPETIINKYITEEWRPYIQTPPFPSYTAGHATISAAAAEAMTNWFGDNLSFIDTSSLEFGIKGRKIESFRLAAQEAARSRMYGGIHYRFDVEEGNKCGRMLGDMIVQKLKFRKTV